MSHSTRKPKCPGCHHVFKMARSTKSQSVLCNLCSRANQRVFRFCRDCQREWPRDVLPSSACTLPNCAFRAALLSDKQISDDDSSANGCPYFRACPNCNALVTHNGLGCPNIECPNCSTYFCYRCLRTRCFYPVLNLHRFLLDDMLPEIEQCTIVDNSQSLKAIH